MIERTSTGKIKHTDFEYPAVPTGNLIPATDSYFQLDIIGSWSSDANTRLLTIKHGPLWPYYGSSCYANLQRTGGGTVYTELTVTSYTTAEHEYTAKAMLRGPVGGTGYIRLTGSVSGSTNGTAVTFDGTWQEVEVTKTFDAADATRNLLMLATINIGESVDMDAVVLEEGPTATMYDENPWTSWLTAVEGDLNTGNLLSDENCSFEGGTVGGYIVINRCSLANDAVEAYHGAHSLKQTITSDGTSATCYVAVTALTSAGSQYTVAAKFKGTVGKSYYMVLYDDVSGSTYSNALVADGTWQTLEATKTFNAGSVTRRIYLAASTVLTGEVAYWDSIILVEGTTATPPKALTAIPVNISVGQCAILTSCDSEAAIITTSDPYTSYLDAGSIVARVKSKQSSQPAGDVSISLAGCDSPTMPTLIHADNNYREPYMWFYDAGTKRYAYYLGNLLYNRAGSLSVYDVAEIRFDAVKATCRVLDPATMTVRAGCEGSYAHTYTSDLWFYMGDPHNQTHYGQMHIDYIQLYTDNRLTVTGAGTGMAAKYHDDTSGQNVYAVEGAGKGNKLDYEDCTFEGSTTGNWVVYGVGLNLIANDATGGYHGTHSLKITVIAPNGGGAKILNVVALADKEYTASIKVRANNASAVGKEASVVLEGDVSGSTWGTGVALTTDWQTITVTHTFAGDATRNLYVRMVNGLAGDEWSIDSAIVAEGAVAVPGTPGEIVLLTDDFDFDGNPDSAEGGSAGTLSLYHDEDYVAGNQVDSQALADGWGGDVYRWHPIIMSVTPGHAKPGDEVTVTGTGLGTLGDSVVVNGLPVVPTSHTNTEIVFITPGGESTSHDIVVTVVGVAASYPFYIVESDVIRFVNPADWDEIWLDVNNGGVCEEDAPRYWKQVGTEFPLPEPQHNWLEPDVRDGEDLISTRVPNRTITLVLLIEADDRAGIDKGVRDLMAQIDKAENCLEYRPAGSTAGSLYYSTFRFASVDLPDYFVSSSRSAGGAKEVTVEIPCLPWAEAAERTLDFIRLLGTNNGFETGDLTGWVDESTGTGLVSVDPAYAYEGTYGVNLRAGLSGAGIMVDDDYIAVDETEYYFYDVIAKGGATDVLRLYLECYDENYVFLGDRLTLENTVTTVWDWAGAAISERFVYPSDNASPRRFLVGTVYVKRRLEVIGISDDIDIDCITFTKASFAADYIVENPRSFRVPPGEVDGDVAAIADLYLDKQWWVATKLLLGQRAGYHADFNPIYESTGQGATTSSVVECLLSDYEVFNVANPVNLVLNPSFETFVGAGNTTNWNNWAETRWFKAGGTTQVFGASNVEASAGTWSCHWGIKGTSDWDYTLKGRNLCDFFAINAAFDHVVKLDWFVDATTYPSYWVYLAVIIRACDGAGAAIATVKSGTYHDPASHGWETLTYEIAASSLPVGTATLTIDIAGCALGGTGETPDFDWYVDNVKCYQWADIYGGYYDFALDAHEGLYLPTASLSVSGTPATDGTMSLYGQLLSDGNELASYVHESDADIGDPNTDWKNVAFQEDYWATVHVPDQHVSDHADKSLITQRFKIVKSETFNGALDIWADYMALVPIDQAAFKLANVPGTTEHIIVDCRSEFQAILTSLDGSLEQASILDTALWDGELKFKADPAGMNLVLVPIYENGDSEECRPIYDFYMKYRPRYWLVQT